MNRALATALAVAAVVGSTAGAVAAAQLAGDDGSNDSPAARGTLSPSGSGDASTPAGDDGGATGSAAPDPALEGVLWANQRELHDGDTTVDIELIDRLEELHRTADGWLVTTASSPQEPSFQVFRIDAEGNAVFVAETFGRGDVSPDGTRYVAMRDDGRGYGIWDIASGELEETYREGPGEGWWPAGQASFSDNGATILTQWTSDTDAADQVLAIRRGSGEQRLVADDLQGAWAASPDGSWLAGTSATAEDPETEVVACLDIRSTADPEDQLTDCGSGFSGTPSFSPDSSKVLAVVQPLDGFGPGLFRVLDSARRTVVGEVDAPDATLDGNFLDDDEVLLLGARNFDGDGTVIYRCDIGGDCETVAKAGDAADTAVLGETD